MREISRAFSSRDTDTGNNMASLETAPNWASLEHTVHGKCIEEGPEMEGDLVLRTGGKFQAMVKAC